MSISRYDVLCNEFNRNMIASKAIADRTELNQMIEENAKFGKGVDTAPALLVGVDVVGAVLCADPPTLPVGLFVIGANGLLKLGHGYFNSPDRRNEKIERVQKIYTQKFDQALKTMELQHPEPEYQEVLLKIRLNAAKENIHMLKPDYFANFNIENKLLEDKIKENHHQHVLEELQPLARQMELYGERQGALEKIVNRKFDAFIEVSQKQSQVLEALKKQGIEITQDLKNAIASSEFIQKDVSAILSYLEKDALDKINQQEHERKLANYQGMMEGFAFLSALGNVVGSKDLSRVAQVAHAGVRIFQQAEQLMSVQLIGAAMLNPIAGIGMAALTIFSLFQKSQDPNQALMEQLKAISRQIERMHKDVGKKLDNLGDKMSYLLTKVLEGFYHLETSSHVHIESKLSQIQNEIITLTKITQTGFEVLVTKNLFDQMQYVDDMRKGLIKSGMPESKFEIRMGKLSRFISEISCSKLFNGLIYEHLLKQNQGATQQIISINSQLSPSILHGLLGLLVRFAQKNIKVEELQNISPEKMVHPGFWQAAVSTYCSMQMFYADKYTYDPQRVTLDTFKTTGNDLLEVVNIFSNSKQFYVEFMKLITDHCKEIEKPLQQLGKVLNLNKIGPNVRQPSLELDSSDELKNNKILKNFLTIDRVLELLKGTDKEIPAVFIQAQALGLGHLEFICHLPIRKRKKHCGYAIRKKELAGLTVIFVSAGEDLRIRILQPELSANKYKALNLQKISSHILLSLTQPLQIETAIKHVTGRIKINNLEKIKQKALETAYLLQENPAYHQLLKLNHFLVTYLILGGFSEELVLKVRNTLLLHDVAGTLANFSKNPWNDGFPKIEVPSNNALNQIQNLIFREIGASKTSQIAAHIYLALQNINECEILMDSISKKSIHIYEGTKNLENLREETQNKIEERKKRVNDLSLQIQLTNEKLEVSRLDNQIKQIDTINDEIEEFHQKLKEIDLRIAKGAKMESEDDLKPVNLPDIVTEQLREKISQLVGHENKFKRFTFSISFHQSHKINIQFHKKKLIIKSQDIESNLIDLVHELQENFMKLSWDQNQYEFEVNPDKQNLIISSHDLNLINRIATMLKNVGMGYWNPNQFKYTEKIEEMSCAIQ